ncbi:MAG: methyltransferase domain-containing protein [Vicinamibacterales bacterium]
MHDALLARLSCPFCGSPVALDEATAVRAGGAVEYGVLWCPCCAYPVVNGIPVMIADDRARAAINAVEAGCPAEALDAALGLDAPRRDAFHALVARGDRATYRDAIEVLSPDAEGTYFVYRLSDPTFVTASAVLRAVAQAPHVTGGLIVDVCGGSGHLTRVLAGLGRAARTIVADLHFWKLWLARHFTAPGVEAVCCDANDPLPFPRGSASLVVLSDAFPYIWRRRALAEELMRLVDDGGALVLPHLHSALGENHSAGMTLSPAAYAALFAPVAPRLFPDDALFADAIDRRQVDLTRAQAPEAFTTEPSCTLIASRTSAVFAVRDVPPPVAVTGTLAVNPLYVMDHTPAGTTLTLRFPTPEYEDEFGACRRYLPDTLTVQADLSGPLDPRELDARLGAQYAELRRRLVLIDAPSRYC